MFKTHLRKVTLIGATVIAAGLALTQTSAAVQQQTPQQPNAGEGAAIGPAIRQMMGNEGQAGAMMVERQQMRANMKATDNQLSDLIAKMDAARGTDKVDAIAAVVKAMVAERAQMRDQMMMQGRMMDQMMSMMGGQKPSDADPAAHHPDK